MVKEKMEQQKIPCMHILLQSLISSIASCLIGQTVDSGSSKLCPVDSVIQARHTTRVDQLSTNTLHTELTIDFRDPKKRDQEELCGP